MKVLCCTSIYLLLASCCPVSTWSEQLCWIWMFTFTVWNARIFPSEDKIWMWETIQHHCTYSPPNTTFIQEMEVVIPDSSKMYSSSGMVESKSVGTFSPFQKQDGHRGLFVDRGVGSPRLVKSSSSSAFSTEHRKDTETKVCAEVHLPWEDYQN